jgi:hypothetical protein
MTIEAIEFNKKEYTLRDIELPEFGFVYIAGTSLQELLFDKDSLPISDEAESVDEQIVFYIEDKFLNLSDKDLKALLISYDI